MALLSRLDHDPDLVAGHFLAVLDEWSRLDPPVHGEADFNVAADIACLDLARLDRQQQPLTAAHEVEDMLRRFHLHRAASMVLIGSTIEPTLLDLDWLLPERGI